KAADDDWRSAAAAYWQKRFESLGENLLSTGSISSRGPFELSGALSRGGFRSPLAAELLGTVINRPVADPDFTGRVADPSCMVALDEVADTIRSDADTGALLAAVRLMFGSGGKPTGMKLKLDGALGLRGVRE